MLRTTGEHHAIEEALATGKLFGFSIFPADDGRLYWYVGTEEQLRAIGVEPRRADAEDKA